jgi:phage tail sheath gpL-like
MPVTIVKNYAEVPQGGLLLVSSADGLSVTATVDYVIGYQAVALGPVVYLNQRRVQGIAAGIQVIITSVKTATYAQLEAAVKAAIAAQEGLTLTAVPPDVVKLP